MKEIRRQRLKKLLESPRFHGDRRAFCAAAGITPGRLTQLLDENEPFGDVAARNLIEALGLPDGFFDRDAKNVSDVRVFSGEVPVISWVQAGNWHEAADSFQPGEAERFLPLVRGHSKNTFALRVRGDSMTSPHGKTYPEGCYIVVDPARMPVNGERIVAKLDGTDEVTFKVYKEEDGRKWLAPLNPMHPPIFDQFRVIGTVITKLEDE